MSASDPLKKAHLLPGVVDSHFHSVQMRAKELDPENLLAWCFSHGLGSALDVSVTPMDFQDRRRTAELFPKLRLTAGIYPSEASRVAAEPAYRTELFSLLREQLDDPLVVAVGEIGLDGFHDYAPLDAQNSLLREQLELAAEHDLPVVIHNRECDGPTLDALRAAELERSGVMHCFSSDYTTARKFADLGFFISFAGNLTFKSSQPLQEAARKLPIDLILVETDSPYLAPVPARGRPNHPGYIGHIYDFLAQLRGEPVERVVARVAENFKRLFDIR